MDGPGEPPHDRPQGERVVIPKKDGKRTLAEKEQKLIGPNHNDQTARGRLASQEQGNPVAAPQENFNEAQGANEETNRAPSSPTASEKEEMIFYLGNHRVNELGFDDDKRGTANRNLFYSKFKPAATASKGAQPAADFEDDDDHDIVNAYNKLATQNREKNDQTQKGLDEIGGDEYRANLRRRLAAEKATDDNRRGNSFFADRGGYGDQRSGGPSHHERGGFTVRDRFGPNKYSPRRQRSAVPAVRRRNSFGGTDASKLPPPRPVDDPQHAAQMAVAKALRNEHNRPNSPRGRGKPFVSSRNFGQHIIASPRASTPPVKFAPFKIPAKLPAASKHVAIPARPVPIAEGIPPVFSAAVHRPPVSTTFDKNWFQNAGAGLTRKTTTNKPSSSALAQRQSSAPSSTGNACQTAHQRVASSSSRGTGLHTQTANIMEQVPDAEFNDIYGVSPRSRYRPPSSDFRTINPSSVQRAASGSCLSTDLNVTTAGIPEVPPTVPRELEGEQEGVWDSDIIQGISIDTGYHRRPRTVPLVQPDLLSLCGSSAAATSPRGAAQELMELENEMPWITRSSITQPDFGPVHPNDDEDTAAQHDNFSVGHSSDSSMLMDFSSPARNLAAQKRMAHATDLPGSNAIIGGFSMPPSIMDDPFEMGPASGGRPALNASAVDITAQSRAIFSYGEEQPAETGHREVPIEERSRRIIHARHEMVALRESTNPELVANIVDNLCEEVRPLQARMAGKRFQALREQMGSSYSSARGDDAYRSSEPRPTPATIVLPKTTSTSKAAPEPASAKKASGGLGQSRWVSPPGTDTTSNAAPQSASASKAPSGLAASLWASPGMKATASAAAPEAARRRQASGGLARSRCASPPRRASASHAIPAATTTSGSAAAPMSARTFAGSEVLVELVKAKKLGGLADSKYADDSPHHKRSKKPAAKPAAPVRAALPPLTPTRGGPGNTNRPQPQGPKPSRGCGRSSGSPATSNAAHENVSQLQGRNERGRGRFGEDGANSVSPSPSVRPRPGPSSPMRSPLRSEKGLGGSCQDPSVAAAFTKADRSALADATNRSRANSVAAPVDRSPKHKLGVRLAGVGEFDPVSWQQTLLNDAQTTTQQQPQPQHEVVRRPMAQQPVMLAAIFPPGPSQPVSTQDPGPLLVSTDSQFPAHMLTGHVWLPALNAPGRVRRRRCLVHGTPWVDPVSATVRANIIYREADGAYVEAFGTLDAPPADAEGNRWFADLFAAADDLPRDEDTNSRGHSFITPRNIQQARLNILGQHRQLNNMWMSGSRALPAAPTIVSPLPPSVGVVSGPPMYATDPSLFMNSGSFVPIGPVDRSHARRPPNPAGPFAPNVTARPSPQRPSRGSQAIPIRYPEDVLTQGRTSSIRSSIATGSQSTTPISAQSSPFVPIPAGVGHPSAAMPIRFRAEARSSSSSPSSGGDASRPSAAIPIRRQDDGAVIPHASQASAAQRSPSPPADTTVGRANGLVNGIVGARRDEINHSPASRQAATLVRQPHGPATENNFSSLARLPRDQPTFPTMQSMLFPLP